MELCELFSQQKFHSKSATYMKEYDWAGRVLPEVVARGDFVCIHPVYRVIGTGTLSNLYANFYAQHSLNSGPPKNSGPGT